MLSATGCIHLKPLSQNQVSSIAEPLAKVGTPSVCPIPPNGYEQMPGYQPGQVDPAKVTQSIEMFSPASSSIGRGGYGGTFDPIEFCGIAKNGVVEVKLFTSREHIQEHQISSDSQKYLIGQAKVQNGFWFITYSFRQGGDRALVARGYDKSGKLIADTNPVTLLRIYSPR